MRSVNFISAVLVTLLVLAGSAPAAVQGLYLFDTLSNPAPDPPFEVLNDSSGNALDLTKMEAFGAVSLDANRPAVMPPGTSALNSVGGGTGSIVTVSTDRFSVARTGELTVEFWYNPETTGLKYIAEFGNEAGNGWDIYESSGTVHAGFRSSVNAYAEMATGTISQDWSHIAVTMAADGTARLYLNGSQVGTRSFAPASFGVTSSFLRLGAGFNATFSNTFLVDELRISDTALLPGNGSGVGELAWNASLVPEPGSLGLLAMVMMSALWRRRA